MTRQFGPCGVTIIQGSGGGFPLRGGNNGSQLISSGATGDIISITPPLGQRVRIVSLYSLSVLQTNTLTLNIAGDPVISFRLDKQTQMSFTVGVLQLGIVSPRVDFFGGGTDEIVTLTTDVATSHNTYITYEYVA